MISTQTQSFLQGEVVEEKYPLVRYLGGSDHSAVFLTQYGGVHPKDAAIKLVAAPPGNAEARLSGWRVAANLSHPHLVRILDLGRCQVGNAAMLYVVTELANENLAEIVPERPLTPEEAREMLAALLDALVFLHGRGFVHGHIKPSNIMAVGEELKLSSDGICRLGEAIGNGGLGAYDPPEGNRGGASTAGDIWSLGITLVEVLTQEAPEWNAPDRRDPVPPETMPPPFPEIVRHCLRREPKNRWPAATIQTHVPKAVVTSARTPARVAERVRERAKGQPRGLAGSFIGKGPVILAAASAATRELRAKWPAIRAAAGAAVRSFSGKWAAIEAGSGRAVRGLRQKPLAVAAAVVALAIVLAGVKLAGRRQAAPVVPPSPRSLAAATSAPGASRSEPERKRAEPARPVRVAAAKSRADGPKRTAEVAERAAPTRPVARPPASATSSAGIASPASANGWVAGRVVQRILPDVPRQASNTIWGTVRVGVRVSVDPLGNVTQAELQAAGPSQYFARLSLEAARKWRFAAPTQNGQALASVWLLHFGYRHDGMGVEPSQIRP
jgi:TonB family protein